MGAADSGAARHGTRGGVWLVLAGLLLVGGAAGFWWRNIHAPAPPNLSTAQLDPGAAALVESEMKAVRAAPRSGAAWGRLGSMLKSYEFKEEAMRCLAIAERLDPKEPRWPYLRGLLLAVESPPGAIAELQRAVDLCGNEPDAPRLRLAKLLAEQGRWEEARRQLQELLRARPGHTSALLALARVGQARGDYKEAAVLARQCADDRHTGRAAWTLLAVCFQRLGDRPAAQEAEHKASALPPDAPERDPFEAEVMEMRGEPRSLSDKAQRLLVAGDFRAAAPVIRRLVEEHPQFSEGWLLLGRMQLLQRNPTIAEQSIRRHLELEPESVNGIFQLGMALLAQERYADAATAFERATRLKPDYGAAYFNLGVALARAGRKPEALPALREAIRHSPEHIDSYILLADLYLQFGQKTEATELARRAQALNPADRRLRALRDKIDRL